MARMSLPDKYRVVLKQMDQESIVYDQALCAVRDHIQEASIVEPGT